MVLLMKEILLQFLNLLQVFFFLNNGNRGKILNYSFHVNKRSKFNPFEPEFRKNSFNLVGKLQLFRSVKLIETHRIM